MRCCCGNFGAAAERQFSERKAAQELDRYRETGPNPTTRALRDSLVEAGVAQGRLLDVGGGIGALTVELLEAGMTEAVIVDASSAYLAAASAEAARRGYAAAIRLIHGDFVSVESQLPPAAVVALDRVVCCYPSFAPLLQGALRHSEHWLALSYPRDVWYVRAGVVAENTGRWVTRNSFRTFVHPGAAMEQTIVRAGFRLASRRRVGMWAADVYLKTTEALS